MKNQTHKLYLEKVLKNKKIELVQMESRYNAFMSEYNAIYKSTRQLKESIEEQLEDNKN